MSTMKVRIGNVLDVHPDPVCSMALNENCEKIALFRGGRRCQIEVWDVKFYPVREKILRDIVLADEKPSVEALVWCKDRLFSCGLHGFIVEHCLESLRVRFKTAATSGPVWCMSKSPVENLIAAGTEDGFVNILEVVDEGLYYSKVLDRQDGRVLCLSWSPCGSYIATGSVDVLRLWDVHKGHAIHRLNIGRSKKQETVVWSILLLDNLSIVSGDSRGIICIWDGKIGVMAQKLYTHKADILSLVLSTDKQCIYAAGVDPDVALLSRVESNDSFKWVRSQVRRMHISDVTSLQTHKNRLFSAGLDSDLIVSSYPPKIFTRYPIIPEIEAVLRDDHLFVVNLDSIALYLFGDNDNDPKKLMELTMSKQQLVNSFAVDDTGSYFCFTTRNSVRFYKCCIVSAEDPPEITKLLFPSSFTDELKATSWKICYLKTAKAFLFASVEATNFFLAKISKSNQINVKPFESELKEEKLTSIDKICSSESTPHFAILCNQTHSCHIFSIQDDCLTSLCKVPKYPSLITSFAFNPKASYILFVHNDRKIRIFDYHSRKLVFGNHADKVKKLKGFTHCTWSSSGNLASVCDSECAYILTRSSATSINQKRTKKSTASEHFTNDTFSLTYPIQPFTNIAFSHFLSDHVLIALELIPTTEKDTVPSSLRKKQFGV